MKTLVIITFLLCCNAVLPGQDCKVIWTELAGVELSVNGDTLTKTGSSGFNAGAVSAHKIPANTDGYLIYKVTSANDSQYIGLTKENNGQGSGDMEFSFYFTYDPNHISRHVRVYVNGSYVLNGGQYDLEEYYRIIRSDTSIYFDRLNGSTWDNIYTTSANMPSGSQNLPELMVDCSLYYVNSKIENVSMSCFNSFTCLKPKLDGSFYFCRNGILRLQVEEDYFVSGDVLKLNIYDKSNTVIYSNTSDLINTGLNQYTIDLAAAGGFTNNAFYRVEVQTAKGRKGYLRIQYTN
ncbi:MAG: hypothetical protein RLP14_02540 [Owenweeksia sp.]